MAAFSHPPTHPPLPPLVSPALYPNLEELGDYMGLALNSDEVQRNLALLPVADNVSDMTNTTPHTSARLSCLVSSCPRCPEVTRTFRSSPFLVDANHELSMYPKHNSAVFVEIHITEWLTTGLEQCVGGCELFTPLRMHVCVCASCNMSELLQHPSLSAGI